MGGWAREAGGGGGGPGRGGGRCGGGASESSVGATSLKNLTSGPIWRGGGGRGGGGDVGGGLRRGEASGGGGKMGIRESSTPCHHPATSQIGLVTLLSDAPPPRPASLAHPPRFPAKGGGGDVPTELP